MVSRCHHVRIPLFFRTCYDFELSLPPMHVCWHATPAQNFCTAKKCAEDAHRSHDHVRPSTDEYINLSLILQP